LTRSAVVFFPLVVRVILARLLAPDDFGLVAMASVFTGVSSIIMDFGTSSAIVQKQKSDAYFESSIFWFNMMIGFGLWLIIILAAPYIAQVYDRPIVKSIIYVQSLTILLSSMCIVPRAILNKDIRFFPLAVAAIASQVIGAVVGISMAVLGFGVWSLVWYSLLTQAFFALPLWVVSSWKLKFHFDLEHIKEILSFSTYLTASKLLNYFRKQGDKFIIGFYIGEASLGYYSKAYGLILRPTKLISGSAGPVLFAAMSKADKANDRENNRLRRLYIHTLQAYTMLNLPLAAILFFWARPLVLLVVGEQWLPAVPLVSLFAVSMWFQAMDNINPIALKSVGRSDWIFKIQVFLIPLFVVGYIVGVRYGTIGVASAYVMATLVAFTVKTLLVARTINLRIIDILSSLQSTIAYSGLLIGVMLLLKISLLYAYPEREWLAFGVSISFSVLVYLIVQLVRPLPAFRYLLDFIDIRKHMFGAKGTN